MACVELMDARALSEPAGRRMIEGALTRLEATQSDAGPEMACWGLGFSFRDLPVDEPSTITTAVILDALTRALPKLSGDQADRCRALHSRTLTWMLDGLPRVHEDGADFPAYSPGLGIAANNVAAYWAGSIARALPDGDPRLVEVRRVASVVLD